MNIFQRNTRSDQGMKRRKSWSGIFRTVIATIFATILLITSCEEFRDPDQVLVKQQEEMFEDWTEYRSAAMGLYAIQQDLVEQLVVLGELRADLLTVTDNATADLKEVNNFNISRENPYASPVNFFKLIGACNKFISQLQSAHPRVTDMEISETTNYDRLYGEVLSMRAWAYFNAVRIYGKVPYIYESLTDVKQIIDYVNSPSEFTIDEYIKYNIDGYHNDTIRDTSIVLTKKFLDHRAVVDSFTTELENEVKVVGVNHSINNGDLTWEVTVWSHYSYRVLLGHMYLSIGDYVQAMDHFNAILLNYTSETGDIRFGLDNKFAYNRWRTIFQGIDRYEHIYTLWFGKSFQQTNKLQQMFSIVSPNQYMVKPTGKAIGFWESMFDDQVADYDNMVMIEPGTPGDFYRGYGVSYSYYKNGQELNSADVRKMLINKQIGNNIDVQILMDNVDTVVNKYSIGKGPYDHDANYIVYRAASVHLYAAEIHAWWEFDNNGTIKPFVNKALWYLNDGYYDLNDDKLGVRGRVGFADNIEAISTSNIQYLHHPHTNEIIGIRDFTARPLEAKQRFIVDKIIEERARELAFEGERFYDLMRVAKRRNDPSYLADRVAEKFSGAEKEAIRQKLMNENNWYIDYFNVLE